jgi:choice-of-anchor B domain-containing protein
MRILFFVFAFLSIQSHVAAQVNMVQESNQYFPNEALSNLWGYTAPGGQEYALVGGATGTYIYQISSTGSLTYITKIDGPTSDWREIKTFTSGTTTYAYVVTEAVTPSPVGVQIINLSGLPGSSLTHKNYLLNIGVGTINKAHALQVDEVAGILYLFGTNLHSGRAIALKLTPDPYNPTYDSYFNYTGSASNHGYVHDGYANNDTLYSSHIYAGAFVLARRTVTGGVASIAQLGTSSPVTTPGVFTHNTWRSGNFLYTTDEVSNSSLTSYDIGNPNAVKKYDEIKGLTTNSIVHNTYIRNQYAVTSWYKDGVAIVDVSRPANLVRVGYYDTHSGTGSGFSGCWGVFPYFPSGRVIISNIKSSDAGHTNDGELKVLMATYQRACHVEGKVTHQTPTGAVISGALVELLNPSNQVILSTTTANVATAGNSGTPLGEYKMGQLTPGIFTLRVSKSGYITSTQSVTLANGSLTFNIVPLQPIAAPIELTRFVATLQADQSAELTWTTATERDNTGFEVEHSTDAINWKSINWTPSQGDSQADQHYAFRTEALPVGEHFFRLAQRDADGTTTRSDVRSVQVLSKKWRANLLPNPVSADRDLTLDVDFGDRQPGEAALHVEIFDARMQATGLRWQVVADEQTLVLPLTDTQRLPAGTYFVVLSAGPQREVLTLVRQ